MGTLPLTADQMLAALKKWGVPWKAYKDDWRTHNRNGGGRAWGPINGFLVHNFASDISDASSLAYLYNGDTARGMPGPLSQFAIDDGGMTWLIGWGRANHGGVGDKGFLDAMIHDRLSLTADYRPATYGTEDMNARCYGVEMLYGAAPTDAQRRAVVRLCAALMDAHGYAATSVGGHRESTTSRSDPVGFKMGDLRSQVAALLKAGPTGTTTQMPTTPIPVTQEDDMPLTNDDALTVWTGPKWFEYVDENGNGVRDARSPIDVLLATHRAAVLAAHPNTDALADAVIAKLPANTELTKDDVKTAVGEVLTESVQVTGSLNVEPKPTA